jgi:hypothetical protein
MKRTTVTNPMADTIVLSFPVNSPRSVSAPDPLILRTGTSQAYRTRYSAAQNAKMVITAVV